MVKETLAVEVGVFEGVNAYIMLSLLPRLKLYLVDTWDNLTAYTSGPPMSREYINKVKEHAFENLKSCNGAVKFTMKNSEDSAKDFPDEYFDYVYIDGDHAYTEVKKDLYLWYPKVKKGGVFGGHDIIMKEVSQAVKEFITENNIPRENTRYCTEPKESDWWWIKE